MSNRKYMLIGWYSRNVTQMMSLTTRFQILILLLNFKRFSDFHDNVSHSHIVVLYTNAEVYVLDLGSREPMNARVALRVSTAGNENRLLTLVTINYDADR